MKSRVRKKPKSMSKNQLRRALVRAQNALVRVQREERLATHQLGDFVDVVELVFNNLSIGLGSTDRDASALELSRLAREKLESYDGTKDG